MGKSRKIITGILVVALAGTGISAGLMQMKKNSVKTVNVTPVSGLLQQYYSSNTTIDGTVTASATQTVSGDKDLIVDQMYVAKGDAVKKGDPLISFDTTLVEMELNIAKLKKQKQEQDLNKAQARLKSLQNGESRWKSLTEEQMQTVPMFLIAVPQIPGMIWLRIQLYLLQQI